MPLDIPWLLRRQDDMADPGLEPAQLTPPPNYPKGGQPKPEVIHNHYYSQNGRPVPWYRRRQSLWAAMGLVALLVVVAVIVSVVLTGSRGTARDRAEGTGGVAGHSSLPSRHPSLGVASKSSTRSSTATSGSSSTASSRSASWSDSVSTHSTRPLNDTVIGILTSFLATFSGNTAKSRPLPSTLKSVVSSTSSSTSPSASSATSSSTSSTSTSSTSTSTKAAEPTASLSLSGRSQLASIYVDNKKSELHRRLLVWQDDKSELIATEWTAGSKVHYRIRDKLGWSMADAKHGTPLAVAANESGVIHVFFLDTQDAISHLVETAAGDWKTGRVSEDDGPIIAARVSSLSAVWHRNDGVALLGVAYESSQQKLRLAMTDEGGEGSGWHVLDVVDLPQPVPGQSEASCFAVAGDWQPGRMLMAVLVEEGLSAWECSVDSWPPSEAKAPCHQVNETLQDATGQDIAAVPPPKELVWIHLGGGSSKSRNSSEHDLSLVRLDVTGNVEEHRIGAGVARKPGRGIGAKAAVRAISATDEAVLFAASEDDVYIYRLDKDGWTWRAEGSLMR